VLDTHECAKLPIYFFFFGFSAGAAGVLTVAVGVLTVAAGVRTVAGGVRTVAGGGNTFGDTRAHLFCEGGALHSTAPPALERLCVEGLGMLGTGVLKDGGGCNGAPMAVRMLLIISWNGSRSTVVGGGGSCMWCAGTDDEGFLSLPWTLNILPQPSSGTGDDRLNFSGLWLLFWAKFSF